jgi:hypothetical protein
LPQDKATTDNHYLRRRKSLAMNQSFFSPTIDEYLRKRLMPVERVRLDRVLSHRPPTPRALLVPLDVVRTLAMKFRLAGNNDAVRLDPSIRADDHLTKAPLITADVHVLAEVDFRNPGGRPGTHISSNPDS